MCEHRIYFQYVAAAGETSNAALHQMGNRGPLSSAMRTFVVGLYVRGHLSSLAEGTIVAGVSKPTLMRWLEAERVSWQAHRLRYLAGMHRKAVMVSEGKSVKRPSKQEQRERATRAKQEWDAKQDPQSGRAIPLEAQAEDGGQYRRAQGLDADLP